MPLFTRRIGKRPVKLMVSKKWLLHRRVTLPAAARENLRQVVAYELDRISPFEKDQAWFVLEVGEPGGHANSRIVVDLWLLPRQRLQPWMDALREAGLGVGAVVAEGRERHDFLPPESRARLPWKHRIARALPLFLALLALAALLLLPLGRLHHQIDRLTLKEDRIQREYEQTVKLQKRLDSRLADLQQTAKRWAAAPEPLEILGALSRLLPDDTYLQQLEIKGREIRLRGVSSQATALIALLEEAPGFEHPRFLSPLTRKEKQELFQLTVTYAPSRLREKSR